VGASEKIIAIGACEESEETLLSGGHRILMSLADFFSTRTRINLKTNHFSYSAEIPSQMNVRYAQLEIWTSSSSEQVGCALLTTVVGTSVEILRCTQDDSKKEHRGIWNLDISRKLSAVASV